jgi:hypothetical protein
LDKKTKIRVCFAISQMLDNIIQEGREKERPEKERSARSRAGQGMGSHV